MSEKIKGIRLLPPSEGLTVHNGSLCIKEEGGALLPVDPDTGFVFGNFLDLDNIALMKVSGLQLGRTMLGLKPITPEQLEQNLRAFGMGKLTQEVEGSPVSAYDLQRLEASIQGFKAANPEFFPPQPPTA